MLVAGFVELGHYVNIWRFQLRFEFNEKNSQKITSTPLKIQQWK